VAVADVPQTAGAHVAAFCKEYIVQTKGRWRGRPLEFEPWQQDFVDEAFALDERGARVYQDVTLGIPRKNGKSTMASGFGLYLLAADGENQPEVYAGAGSKNQAEIVFQQAALMVQKSPRLLDFLRVQRHDIAAPFNDGVFKAIASDGDLAAGIEPAWRGDRRAVGAQERQAVRRPDDGLRCA
jgi:phage terminase large subunit-like protein